MQLTRYTTVKEVIIMKILRSTAIFIITGMIVLMISLFSGCAQSNTPSPTEQPNTPAPLSLIATALQVVSCLDTQDTLTLSEFVHPTLGVRFSPYGYVDVDTDLTFTSEAIQTLRSDTQVFTWGSYDGTGDPIVLNGKDYFERFIYDQDYLNPDIIGINNLIGTGNTLVNIQTIFPNASFVEFHLKGFEAEYAGMDWRSLILVFEQLDQKWYLTGIVHNEWTI